eukprot:m.33279 g.33279  ORF g.33279 m.33279 type:complete len:126 (-) comp8511_c0_seq2:1259-1636(-)
MEDGLRQRAPDQTEEVEKRGTIDDVGQDEILKGRSRSYQIAVDHGQDATNVVPFPNYDEVSTITSPKKEESDSSSSSSEESISFLVGNSLQDCTPFDSAYVVGALFLIAAYILLVYYRVLRSEEC